MPCFFVRGIQGLQRCSALDVLFGESRVTPATVVSGKCSTLRWLCEMSCETQAVPPDMDETFVTGTVNGISKHVLPVNGTCHVYS